MLSANKRTAAAAPGSDQGPSAKKQKSKGGGGLSLAELREKHRRERQAGSSASISTAIQTPSAPMPVATAPGTAPLEKPKTKAIIPQPQPQQPAPELLPKPRANVNPFSVQFASNCATTSGSNPFGVLKTIESTAPVAFPVANRLMTRYNSSPNILHTSPWSKREPLTISKPPPNVNQVSDDDDGDNEEDSQKSMSDLECTPDDDNLLEFRMASSTFETSLPSAVVSRSDFPTSRIHNVNAERVDMDAEGTTKPRLFSILVGKKSSTFQKTSFSSCNQLFQPSSKKEANNSCEAQKTKDVVMPDLNEEPAADSQQSNDFDFDPIEPVAENQTTHDYSLKTGLTIISTGFQPWFQARSNSENCSTLQNHIKKAPVSSMTLKEQFDRNLISHVYPNGPKAPTHVGLMTRILAIKPGTALKPFEQNELAFFMAKEEEWRQSFKSVFSTLDQGHTEYFYYINSEFTVLFQSPAAPGNPTANFRAVMTKASAGLRTNLALKEIKFKAVVPPGKVKTSYSSSQDANEEEKVEARNELKEMEQLQPGRTIAKSDYHLSPVALIFEGLETLNQLHQYLLKWVEQSVEKRALHQPVLISPSPFLNASMKFADIVKIEQIESISASTTSKPSIIRGATLTGTTQTAHKLRILGFLLPPCMANIISVIESSSMRGDHVRIIMDVEERTVGLNLESGSTVRLEEDAGSKGSTESSEQIDEAVCGKTVKAMEYFDGKWV